MTGTLPVFWQVTPLTPPLAQRPCSTCGKPQPFRSSGKVRLNANGRRLDAWLIYKCTVCDRTWNLPILTRVPVSDVPPADLAAMQSSAPEWVQARAFDPAVLRRHAIQVLLPSDLRVTKRLAAAGPAHWSRIALTITADWPTGQRLDRLLATELALSRTGLLALQDTGGLCVASGAKNALKAPLTGTVVLQFDLDRMTAGAVATLARAFGVPFRGP